MTAKIITGGDKLKRALNKIAKQASNAASVNVGFLETAKYPDGKPVAMIAAIQEFGAPRAGIRPRSFFRTMVEAKKSGWPNALARNLVAQDYDAAAALDAVGMGIGAQLQESITQLTSPPLSEVTLMLRKMYPVTSGGPHSFADVAEARARVAAGESVGDVSTKPLVWTGDLLRSVDHEVTTTAVA